MGQQKVKEHIGWRGIWLDGERRLAEDVFYSDETKEDHLSVTDPKISFSSALKIRLLSVFYINQAGQLEVTLTEEECREFESCLSPVEGRRYWKVWYKVRFILDGNILTYEFIISRRGAFPARGDGANPITYTAKLNVGAALRIR